MRRRLEPGMPPLLPCRHSRRHHVRPAGPVQLPAPAPASTGRQLYTPEGARKYLTAAERDVFLAMAERADRDIQTLCMTLAYSGCRLSEALVLTVDRVDLAAGVLVFESLKKRRSGIYRAMPMPPALLQALVMAHGVRELQSRRGRSIQVWPEIIHIWLHQLSE